MPILDGSIDKLIISELKNIHKYFNGDMEIQLKETSDETEEE